jgi:hypothetical protein
MKQFNTVNFLIIKAFCIQKSYRDSQFTITMFFLNTKNQFLKCLFFHFQVEQFKYHIYSKTRMYL